MILVTGGTGLVGSHLLLELVKTNKSVIAIKQKNSNIERVKKIFSYYSDIASELFEKINWVNCDIRDYYKLTEIIADVKTVYHSAAYVSYVKKEVDLIFEINIKGTRNIVNACLENNIEKLCYVSSIASLGSKANGQFITEETNWTKGDSSNYSKSKYYSELEIHRGIAEGLNTVIVNPSVILGAGFWEKGSSALFKKSYEGLKFYTNGSTGFVDVRDIVKIMIKLTNENKFNETYILNSDNYTYKEFFTKTALSLGSEPPRIYANNFYTNTAFILDWIKSKLTGKDPLITKETARTAHKKLLYSNKKITEAIHYNFISVDKSISDIAKIFLSEN